jgi:hypothetical protein
VLLLRLWFRAAVSHIQDYFPGAIPLLLPDGVVFAVRDDGLAIFARRPELIGAIGVTQVMGLWPTQGDEKRFLSSNGFMKASPSPRRAANLSTAS